MKKIIALLLAVIMTFSLGTVAFATDADLPAEETTTAVSGEDEGEAEGQLDWLLDLPFWTLGPGSWFAKMALKLVTVFVKIAAFLKIVESTGILEKIQEIIDNSKDDAVVEDTTAALV